MNELEKMVWAAAFAARSISGYPSYDCAHEAERAVEKFREVNGADRWLRAPCLNELLEEGSEVE